MVQYLKNSIPVNFKFYNIKIRLNDNEPEKDDTPPFHHHLIY